MEFQHRLLEEVEGGSSGQKSSTAFTPTAVMKHMAKTNKGGDDRDDVSEDGGSGSKESSGIPPGMRPITKGAVDAARMQQQQQQMQVWNFMLRNFKNKNVVLNFFKLYTICRFFS